MNSLQKTPFPNRIWHLFKSDALNISRDPILLMVTILSVIPPLLFARFSTDLDQFGQTHFSVETLSTFLAPCALLLPAYLLGWVSGFLLLEDRDDHTLLAIETTSFGKIGFFSYRLILAAMVGGGLTWFTSFLIFPNQPIELTILICGLVGAQTATVALILLALASNKVEGLALSKLLNMGILFPIIAAFPSPWRLFGGVFPSYWIGEIYMLSTATYIPTAISIFIAFGVHLIWLAAMLTISIRRYEHL
ncbi:hypothetical protein [Maritalea porphyrae]|uniref:ABC transporter permease n=1 Tax=Maritalea porphyrae TaxID=880732 RepID=A0ABQ5UNJ0_9HYPH|nr:hypothetical protein [Maritalea porphyrae]GLQ16419.1 hypothetical protein GCM10007879_06680 [Maritalea porphyrae]